MKNVRPKKKLGQHFLTDLNIAEKIADLLEFENYQKVLEIGPGTGVLTQFLIPKTNTLHLVEIDQESIQFLQTNYSSEEIHLIEADFLKLDLNRIFSSEPFAIIGNFPYNISSQIVFKVLENRIQIPFFAGMFQKEVAERICEPPGSKKYGILSVLSQLYYETEYLFTVPPTVFNPPPKVDSAVIRLTRKQNIDLDCDEALLKKVVKLSFQQRRKTLRNSLKTLNLPDNLREDSIFDLRPEKLSGDDFIHLTKRIGHGNISN
ncbi:MAG: 16S rRNA (adenine(1518)-N(6)/adenine(1519)-N(6))-dimethyltransferase RsmA [Flavobacteriaceae bacterium]|nr:16S rRNA (adenine(1518)-N(6)/adenine(1519)-N(6))-dimethyltransferase RsmA [Flavobacteriaceae bacterium]MDG2387555.1 16S rRNA (adenine(1518)-N(6)/adenine(1519)-N(6))-dimethyltransferase RsmA [Flavobacteriaceae bacterium]